MHLPFAYLPMQKTQAWPESVWASSAADSDSPLTEPHWFYWVASVKQEHTDVIDEVEYEVERRTGNLPTDQCRGRSWEVGQSSLRVADVQAWSSPALKSMLNPLSDFCFWSCDSIKCKSDPLHPTGVKIEKKGPNPEHGAVKSILPAAPPLFGLHLHAAQKVHGCDLQLAVLFRTDCQPSSHLEMILSAGLFELLAIRTEGSLRDGTRLKMHHCTTGKESFMFIGNVFTFNTTLQQSPVDSYRSHQWFCWGWTDSAALRRARWGQRTYLKVNFSALPPSGCYPPCSSLKEQKHRTVLMIISWHWSVNKCNIVQICYFIYMNKKWHRTLHCIYVMQEKDIDLLVSIRFLHIAQYLSFMQLLCQGHKRYNTSLLLHVNELQNHP